MQIVISNGLANFVTTFSDLAVTVTFGNFSKEFENFLWNILVSMMSKVNIRQSTADFWQSWSKFLSFTRGFYSILSTSLLKLPEISNNWFWLGCSNICKSISSDILTEMKNKSFEKLDLKDTRQKFSHIVMRVPSNTFYAIKSSSECLKKFPNFIVLWCN